MSQDSVFQKSEKSDDFITYFDVKKVENQHVLNGRTDILVMIIETDGRIDPNYRKAKLRTRINRNNLFESS